MGKDQKSNERRERESCIKYIKRELVQLQRKLDNVKEDDTHAKDVIQMHML